MFKIVLMFTIMASSLDLYAAESHVLYDKLGVDVIASDASQTTSYIKEEGSKDQYCAGTGSDFAGFSGKGFSFGGKESIGFDDNHGVQSFGGRTPLVLITREMMFRACELSLNTHSNREQSIEIYKLFLQTLQALGGDQQLTGTSASSSTMAGEKANSNRNADNRQHRRDEDSDNDNDNDSDSDNVEVSG